MSATHIMNPSPQMIEQLKTGDYVWATVPFGEEVGAGVQCWVSFSHRHGENVLVGYVDQNPMPEGMWRESLMMFPADTVKCIIKARDLPDARVAGFLSPDFQPEPEEQEGFEAAFHQMADADKIAALKAMMAESLMKMVATLGRYLDEQKGRYPSRGREWATAKTKLDECRLWVGEAMRKE